MLRTSELDYDLPTRLIARHPANPRDSARMLVARGTRPHEHRHVRDLPDLLREGDLLVLNTTHVLPAWLVARRVDTGGSAEGLFIHALATDAGESPRWVVFLRAKHVREGMAFELLRGDRQPTGIVLNVEQRAESEPGAWVVRVVGTPHGENAAATLARIGGTPIPPYIQRARREAGEPEHIDRDASDYQTTFADATTDAPTHSSVAAPTAGLHLTPELLRAIESKGVQRASVVLHVGPGTFKPVETEFVEDHPIHAEWCLVPKATADAIVQAKSEGRRVIAVGTTSARTLEAFAGLQDPKPDDWFETRILITPGYRWRWVDGLLTNFHLPKSTLMAMVAAILPGGPAGLRSLYADAVHAEYRFYSFGDAMLILPEA